MPLARLSPLVAPLLVIAGCAHYEPKPLIPEQTLRRLEERRLSDPDVLSRVEKLGPVTWDRAQLLVAALEINPTLAEARAQLAQASAALGTAREIQNPTVSLSSEYDVQKAGESPWLWGVTTDFLLAAFLGRPQRIDLAHAGLRGAQADFSEAIWTVRRDLRAALLSVMIARKRIDALEVDLRQRTELATLARHRVAAGESARGEESQAQLERSRSQAALDDARQTLEDGKSALATALGVSRDAIKEIEPHWDDLDQVAALEPSSWLAMRDHALLSRPDLERAVADYAARDVELRQQVRAQYLQTSIGPGYTWDHGVRKVTLGVSFPLPIFNHNEGPIAESNAARDAAGAHAIAVQAKILSEVDTAAAGYSTALASLQRVREQRAMNESLAVSARRALDLDGGDKPTWLTAELAVSTDRIAEIDALDRVQQALGQLEDALRAPITGPETRLPTLETP